VQADPKQYAALLMLARGIGQRTREFDLDREEKLTRAEKYAKDALDILKDAPKPEWMEKGIPYLQREKEKEKYRVADEDPGW